MDLSKGQLIVVDVSKEDDESESGSIGRSWKLKSFASPDVKNSG